MTGFSAAVRQLVTERSGGVCEIQVACTGSRASAVHHRRPRGFGGSNLAWVNQAGNALATCEPCHRFVESNRTAATRKGLLVSLFTLHPSAYVVLKYRGRSVLLDDMGGVGECEAP